MYVCMYKCISTYIYMCMYFKQTCEVIYSSYMAIRYNKCFASMIKKVLIGKLKKKNF